MHHALAPLFAIAMLLAPSAWAATIYKCKSPAGALLYQEKPCAEESKSVASWGSASGSPLVMSQGDNGHYYVDGSVNEHKLNFVIDTGASLVSLPQEVATSAGLLCQRQSMAQTANGLTRTCTTTIQTLKFGTFTLKNVEAMISPNLNQPLLGMNVLKQFRVEQDSGEMRLSIK
jgi:aspartyl protease family protein